MTFENINMNMKYIESMNTLYARNMVRANGDLLYCAKLIQLEREEICLLNFPTNQSMI